LHEPTFVLFVHHPHAALSLIKDCYRARDIRRRRKGHESP